MLLHIYWNTPSKVITYNMHIKVIIMEKGH